MIIELLKQHRSKIIIASVVSAISGVANIWVLQLVNRYATGNDELSSAVTTFAFALALMVGIGLGSQLFLAKMSANFFYVIRQALTCGIAKLTHQRLENIGGHRLYSTLTADVNLINGFLSSLPNYVYNLTVVVACFIYMASMSFELFAVFAGFATLGILVSQLYFLRKGEVRFRASREAQDKLYNCYDALIHGNKELILHKRRAEDFHHHTFEPASSEFRDKSYNASMFWSFSASWFSTILFVAVGSIVFLSRHYFGHTTEMLMQFMVVVLYLVGPITILVDSLSKIATVKVVLRRLTRLEVDIDVGDMQDLAKASQKTLPAVKAAEPFGPFQKLKLENVCFTYEHEDAEQSFSVGPVTCEFMRGDIIYLVGGNGSGKTTVSKIMAGLYDATSGDIYLNGQLKSDSNRDDYYRYFSSVFSDYYLFDKVIRKDGLQVSDQQLNNYLNKLGLTGKTNIENGVLSTTKLSAGQKKRLALLVSCFDNADVYIFDEWAAEQDPVFREFFYMELLPELKQTGKTIIVVTHDDRYFHLADHLVRFERGKIVSNNKNKARFDVLETTQQTQELESEVD